MRNIIYNDFCQDRRFGVELEVSNNLTKQDLADIVNEYESIYNNKKKIVCVTPGLEGWAQTKNNSYWHVKFDRTCGPIGKNIDNGWEIASYIGCGNIDIDHISRLARFLQAAGAETNINCGLHIHVEVSDFDEINMGILLARWLKIEKHLVSICHPSRHNNKYCDLLSKKIFGWQKWYDSDNPSQFWRAIRPCNLSIHNNFEKRVTLNSIGFAIGQLNKNHTRITVELRLPESVLDEKYVRNWIRLMVHFVNFSKKIRCPPKSLDSCKNLQQILSYLGLSGENDFFVLSPELLNTKFWFLQKIIHNSQDKKIVKQAQKYLKFISSF